MDCGIALIPRKPAFCGQSEISLCPAWIQRSKKCISGYICCKNGACQVYTRPRIAADCRFSYAYSKSNIGFCLCQSQLAPVGIFIRRNIVKLNRTSGRSRQVFYRYIYRNGRVVCKGNIRCRKGSTAVWVDCVGNGSKVWHSNDKYRKVIYQCNHKFKGQKKCKTPHLDEETIKRTFISALNKLISCRNEIFENLETVKKVIFDTTDLDAELTELQGEMTVIAEMIQKCVDENARTKVDQDDYRKRYEGLVTRFETAKARLTEVTDLCKDKMVRREMTESFIAELRKQNELVSEFDERLWHTLLDHATVYNEKDVGFTFKDGTIISA